MKFTVEIPDDTVEWAQAEGINRQTLAKFMREELQMIGSRHGHAPQLKRQQIPGQSHDWRGFIFNEARVICQKLKIPSVRSVLANSISRPKEA